jgi:hypothetical protein
MGVSERRRDTSELESDRLSQVCEQSSARNYHRHEEKKDENRRREEQSHTHTCRVAQWQDETLRTGVWWRGSAHL